MKLWLLQRPGDFTPGQVPYDEGFVFVVRAEDPSEARRLAAQYKQEEAKMWLDKKATICSRISTEGDSGVCFSSINYSPERIR